MLRNIDSYDRFSGILYTDILEADICDILEIGIGYDESVFLTNSQGIILSHKIKELPGTYAFSPVVPAPGEKPIAYHWKTQEIPLLQF
ncbi:MAG: hypothetical protein GX045_08475 [Clostridiaceae bacterium]|nr:hypothetical protein [Clostridiaceae bacterium]